MIDFIQYLPYKGNYPQLSSLNDQSLRSLSPEYLFNGEVNEKTDIWGFGCILVCFCFFLGIALVWIDYGYSSLPDQQHSFHLWLFHSLFWPSLQWDHSSIFSFFPFDIYRVIKMLLCILIRMRLTTRFSIDITYSSLLLSSHSIEFFYSSTIKVSSTVHLSNKQESIIPIICIFPFFYCYWIVWQSQTGFFHRSFWVYFCLWSCSTTFCQTNHSVIEFFPSVFFYSWTPFNYSQQLQILLEILSFEQLSSSFDNSYVYNLSRVSRTREFNNETHQLQTTILFFWRPSRSFYSQISTNHYQRVSFSSLFLCSSPTIPPPPPPKLRINTEISPFISFSPPPPRTFPRYNIPVSFSLSPPALYSDCSMHHSDVSKRFTFSNSQPADISIIEDCVIDDTIAAPENEFSVLDTPPSLQHTPTESTKDSFSIPYPISRSTHLSHTPRVSNSINLPTSTPSSITNLTLSSQAYSNFHSSSSPLSRTSITRPMSPQRRYSSDHKKNSFQILRHSNSVNLSDQEHPPSESQHSVLSSSPSPLGGVPHPVNINLDILQTPETFTAFPPYSLFTTPSNEQS